MTRKEKEGIYVCSAQHPAALRAECDCDAREMHLLAGGVAGLRDGGGGRFLFDCGCWFRHDGMD
jgi:hypothetical protein